MLTTLALRSIRFYQRHLSPLKGFRCAYGLHSGRPTCSAQGARGFQRAGFIGGLKLLQRQFDRCVLAAAELRACGQSNATGRYRRYGLAQRGFVDCDCGGGDCPGADCSPDCPDCSMPDCSAPDCSGPDCQPFGACSDTPALPGAGCGSRVLGVLDCLSWLDCADCGSCSSSDTERRTQRVAAAAGRQLERQARRDKRRPGREEEAAQENESLRTPSPGSHAGSSEEHEEDAQ